MLKVILNIIHTIFISLRNVLAQRIIVFQGNADNIIAIREKLMIILKKIIYITFV